MSYKRILLSVSMIAFVGALVVGATGAFFSDTETSTGNTFTAGAVDLQVANTSYFTNANGELEQSTTTTFKELGDDGQLFFDFADLKPGDIGEDTITINVDDNDAWACMANDITATPENDVTEPESEVDDTTGDNEGELQDELMFAVWADDGDNVYEDDERLLNLGDGNTSFVTAQELADQGVQTLADANYNLFTDDNGQPLDGGEDYHIGKAWCHGDMSEDPVDQDEATTSNPVEREETGFDCDGSEIGNETQTDGIESALKFYAVQSRNNDEFTCEGDFDPNFGDDDEGEVESNTGDGFGTLQLDNDDFSSFARARFGDNNSGTDAPYELAVGTDPNVGSTYTPEGFDWSDGDTESFTLSWDASNNSLELEVDGASTSQQSLPAPESNKLALTAKIASGSSQEASVSGLSLNTGSIAGPTSFTEDGTTPRTEYLLLSGIDYSQDFELSGDVTFSNLGSSTSEEEPGLTFELD